jgi:hypothetical protein
MSERSMKAIDVCKIPKISFGRFILSIGLKLSIILELYFGDTNTTVWLCEEKHV